MIGHLVDLARQNGALIVFAAPLAGAALVVLTPMARLAWFVAATSAIVAAPGTATLGAAIGSNEYAMAVGPVNR